MEPLLIWPNITIGLNGVFVEILALTRLRHMVCSKVENCADKNVVISNIQTKIICDIPYCLENEILKPNDYTGHT